MLSITHKLAIPIHRWIAQFIPFDNEFIFIVGTMRSGSSLLANVLNSNRQVAGFGETHICYSNKSRMFDLYYWTFRFTKRYPIKTKYVLDKILHAKHIPEIESLNNSYNIRYIFLTRDPSANAASLVKMSSDFGTLDNPRLAYEYLVQRYKEQSLFLSKLPKSAKIINIDFESLIGNQKQTLNDLSVFLELENKLSSKYTVHKYTGRWGLGDGSAKIRSGVIDKKADHYITISQPPDEVMTAYYELKAAMRNHCS